MPGQALTGFPTALWIAQQIISPGSKEQNWDGADGSEQATPEFFSSKPQLLQDAGKAPLSHWQIQLEQRCPGGSCISPGLWACPQGAPVPSRALLDANSSPWVPVGCRSCQHTSR